MKTLGRIIARDGIAGIYIPFKFAGNLLDGVYEVREIMGELTLHFIGESALQESWPAKYTGMDLEGLFNQLPTTGMTAKELENTK